MFTPEEVIQNIQQLSWKKWIRRPFGPFIASMFKDGIRKENFEKIGISNVECKAWIYQKGMWYESKEVWEEMGEQLKEYCKDHSVFDVTASLEAFKKEKRERIRELIKEIEKGNPIKQFKELYEIFTICTTYIWMTHGLEEGIYNQRIKELVPKYITEDIDKFIGDASFPIKKNAHVFFEEAMRRGDDPKEIVEKFGWIRVRDGFSDPFTEEDIKKQIKELTPTEEHKPIKILEELKQLFKEMQELVFFRTERTDVLYELFFLARPIIKAVGKKYGIPFKELKFYTIQSLIEGNPKKYSIDFTYTSYQGDAYIGEDPILKEEEIKDADFVKGMKAHGGKVKGTVKIVRFVSELEKVKEGDILVTQMTFPSFIAAMYRAAAFVTDEGGITCHAAIVAREMKKPCVTGTREATNIFKDGDYVEVDADNSIMKKINRE